jgi:two-component system, NarL family, nitrate/nitrite response regulator NarL
LTGVAATVVLADDHVPMRETVAVILERSGFNIVGQAGDAPGAIALAKRRKPAVCILDINMPGGGGIEAARTISVMVPETAVVMLTVHVDDDHLFDALRAGARGYIVKGTSPDVMVASLREVLNGEPGLSPGLAMRILEQFRGTESRRIHVPDRGFVELSPREAEVLDLLRQGLSTSLVAQRLYVSPVTVRSHIASAVKKLKAADRDDALRMFDT